MRIAATVSSSRAKSLRSLTTNFERIPQGLRRVARQDFSTEQAKDSLLLSRDNDRREKSRQLVLAFSTVKLLHRRNVTVILGGIGRRKHGLDGL
jgi:hypothetical protein